MNHRKWKMRNRQKIWIKDMSDNHLLNTMKMLHRNACRECDYNGRVALDALNHLQGEYAILSMENELSRDWWEFLPSIYNSLLSHARKREFWNKELEEMFNLKSDDLYFYDISPYWVEGRKDATK